jgi:twitching motility protein PilJ
MINGFNGSNKANQLKVDNSQMRQSKKAKRSLLQSFYNLPISRKQLIALVISQLVPILGIGIAARLIITNGLQTLLLEQAKSEATVVDINYNIKINQMGFGFRGQSDNTGIIGAAIYHNAGREISPAIKAEVKQILRNEIKARNIEYATLVGTDKRIIVSANADRTGEVFNPENLVSEVLKNPKQIKFSGIVSRSELSKEAPPLPEGFKNEDALIRYTVTPVREPNSKEVIGALISGDIVNGKDKIVQSTLKSTGGGYSAIYLRKPTGEFFLVSSLNKGESQDLNESQANLELPAKLGNSLLEAAAKAKEGQIVTERMAIGNQTYTMAARAIPNKIIEEGNGSRNIFSAEPTAIIVRGTPETSLNNLLAKSLSVELTTVALALAFVAIWALILRQAMIQPIQNLQQTAQKFATGDRTTRADIFATDEIGELAATFNTMADNLNEQSYRQETEAKLAQQLNEITSRLRESLNGEKILKGSVQNTRDVIKADRVLFYRLNENWEGSIIAESVAYEWSAALGLNFANPYLAQEYSEEYELGSIKAVSNIYEAGLSQHYVEQLEPLSVKAYLLAPIFVNQKLHGLFVAHQCSSDRHWQDLEINLFKQVAIQVGYALEQAQLLLQVEQGRKVAESVSTEERQIKEALQMQILELLDDIEGVTQGDLTVRADVSEGEIGTVADFFNSIVESLRDIVSQVKTSVTQVNYAIGSNEGAIRQLAEEALNQASEINRTLDAVDSMTNSIKAVAANAQQAAVVANQAAVTANQSGEAMDLTVQNILTLRETVGETTKKVKRLGESSQEISRVVALIKQIATQTNLLAINAGIEAARAGEEGQGFAIVAEEVGELAARSTYATQEIEQIVENIQRETSEVVEAMEQGTAQVVEGTRIVEGAKQSLRQILDVSRKIDSLVQSISTATTSQVETSQSVTELMKGIALVSQRTSDSSRQVSQSLQQTVEISHELQQTVETFKID